MSKRYQDVLKEVREIRRDLINTEQLLQNKEAEHHHAENML